jgi:hypothetical protein
MDQTCFGSRGFFWPMIIPTEKSGSPKKALATDHFWRKADVRQKTGFSAKNQKSLDHPSAGYPRPPLVRFRKQWPEKRTFITDEAARLSCEGHCLLNVWIGASVLTVLFVSREAGKAKHSHGDITLSFGWQKVAVMYATEPWHQLKPHCTVSFKVGELIRIDLVTQVAGNHPLLLRRKVEWALGYIWGSGGAPCLAEYRGSSTPIFRRTPN